MGYSSTEIGDVIRQTRVTMNVTQEQLALTAGTGLRFIVDLEKGKPTCELQKTLNVLQALGISITLSPRANYPFAPAPKVEI